MPMKLWFHRNDGTGLGWFVKTFERGSRYDHVELEFSDGVSFSCVANEGIRPDQYGVRSRVIKYDTTQWDYMVMPHGIEAELETRAWAEGSKGKGYDFFSLFFYLPFAFRGAANLYICSEWCEEAVRYSGKFTGLDSGTLKSPTKLADALIECGVQMHPSRG